MGGITTCIDYYTRMCTGRLREASKHFHAAVMLLLQTEYLANKAKLKTWRVHADEFHLTFAPNDSTWTVCGMFGCVEKTS